MTGKDPVDTMQLKFYWPCVATLFKQPPRLQGLTLPSTSDNGGYAKVVENVDSQDVTVKSIQSSDCPCWCYPGLAMR